MAASTAPGPRLRHWSTARRTACRASRRHHGLGRSARKTPSNSPPWVIRVSKEALATQLSISRPKSAGKLYCTSASCRRVSPDHRRGLLAIAGLCMYLLRKAHMARSRPLLGRPTLAACRDAAVPLM